MSTLYSARPCRVCGGELETIFDMGPLHPSGFFRPDETPLDRVPHDLCACVVCRAVQLRHTVDPDLMFRRYWYQSGINDVMREELADVVRAATARVPMEKQDIVLDIGANDGTLLSNYPQKLTRIAIEPALNLNEACHRWADVVFPNYFPYIDLIDFHGHAKIVTAIACFYAHDDPIAFLNEIRALLHPEGVCVIQFQDWQQMQACTAFDNICTEHLLYPSLKTIERLAAMVGLRVVDGERRGINGGSLRLFLQHNTGQIPTENIFRLHQLEAHSEMWETYDRFGQRCEEAKRQIQAVVDRASGYGYVVDVYGASTKFNTLAQWCGLTGVGIRQAWERSPEKWGLRTVTGIPIVNEVVGRIDPPQTLVVGIWQFRNAVILREQAYLEQGGTLVFPLPEVDIVRAR